MPAVRRIAARCERIAIFAHSFASCTPCRRLTDRSLAAAPDRRLLKETDHYRKELEANRAKLEDMLAAGQDVYDVKLFRQVVAESEAMVPDAARRLGAALEELRDVLAASDSDDLRGEWREAAEAILAEHAKDPGDEDVVRTDVEHLDDAEVF